MATPTEPRDVRDRRPAILSAVLRAHGATLRRQAVRNCSLSAEVEDALQDACVEFLRSYAGGEAGEHALRYLMLAVKHAAWARSRRAVRAASVELSATDELDGEEPCLLARCERPGPAERIARREQTAAAFAALDGLKRDERTALLLLAFGYSYSEIASRQGWTRTKVNRCLAEGRQALRKGGEFAALGP